MQVLFVECDTHSYLNSHGRAKGQENHNDYFEEESKVGRWRRGWDWGMAAGKEGSSLLNFQRLDFL